MNSRRFISDPKLRRWHLSGYNECIDRREAVTESIVIGQPMSFGHQATIKASQRDVCFTPGTRHQRWAGLCLFGANTGSRRPSLYGNDALARAIQLGRPG